MNAMMLDAMPTDLLVESPTRAAARAVDATKVYGKGEAEVRALDGVTVDLQGILLKPAGSGPFGAVVISHGAGGNVSALPRTLAIEMRRWGLVGIATNYTHSAGVPIGAPGTANDPGASDANVQRAHAVREIL